MIEVVFLAILAFAWIVFAVIQDLRKREIANWLNFSLIIFALGFRFFYSLFSLKEFVFPVFNLSNISILNPISWFIFVKEFFIFIHLFLGNFSFFQQGIYGLLIFLAIGNLFYYGRFFAGGDAKLMIALGAVLPFSKDFLTNARFFIFFLFIFLFAGAGYGLIMSVMLSIKHHEKFRKEFSKQLKAKKKIIYWFGAFGFVFVVLGFFQAVLFFLGILFFVFPFFYSYAKAIDESCMVKKLKPGNLREGDWLYRDVELKGREIKAKWQGLTKRDIQILRKRKKSVLIREGIAFSPAFLISFIVFVLFKDWFLLWNSFW